MQTSAPAATTYSQVMVMEFKADLPIESCPIRRQPKIFLSGMLYHYNEPQTLLWLKHYTDLHMIPNNVEARAGYEAPKPTLVDSHSLPITDLVASNDPAGVARSLESFILRTINEFPYENTPIMVVNNSQYSTISCISDALVLRDGNSRKAAQKALEESFASAFAAYKNYLAPSRR
jgi:hypothetical protein